MEFQFDKLVNSILNEWGGDNIRSQERNAGLNARIALKVTWAKSGKEDFLRNPETKKPVVFGDRDMNKWQYKAEQLKNAGKITAFRFQDV